MDTYVMSIYWIGFYLSQQVSCKYLHIMNRIQTNHEVLDKGKLMMITMIARWYMLSIQCVIESNAFIISSRTFRHKKRIIATFSWDAYNRTGYVCIEWTHFDFEICPNSANKRNKKNKFTRTLTYVIISSNFPLSHASRS